jgi:hypothetical protein
MKKDDEEEEEEEEEVDELINKQISNDESKSK